MIASGVARPGDRIRVQPSGKQSSIARIVTFDGDLERAVTDIKYQVNVNPLERKRPTGASRR